MPSSKPVGHFEEVRHEVWMQKPTGTWLYHGTRKTAKAAWAEADHQNAITKGPGYWYTVLSSKVVTYREQATRSGPPAGVVAPHG